MLDPRSILVALPCGDGRLMAETAGMLVSARNMFGAISIISECSIIQIARNRIADAFLSSPYEWLVSMDSDIVATPEDLRLLLEPCDETAQYLAPEDEPRGTVPPRPSRVIVSQLNARPGEAIDFNSRTAGAVDMLVTCEYSYKSDALEPVKFGFGLVRIHRSVFECLQKLEHPVNPDSTAYENFIERVSPGITQEDITMLKRCRPDPGGGPRLWCGADKGRMLWDYFPTGPLISNLIPTA